MEDNELDLQDSGTESSGDDFDDIDLSDVDLGTDDEAGEKPDTADKAPDADTKTDDKTPVTPTKTDEKTTETQPASDPTFELKYLGEIKTVNKDEVVKLAQQGMDYDRIRAKLDEAKLDLEQYADLDDGIAYLRELAQTANMSVNKYIENIRVQALVNAGWAEKDATEKVAYDRNKRIDAAKQAKTDRAAKIEADKKEERERMFQEFANLYPDVKPESIPPEVIAASKNGKNLSDAYELHTAKASSK
jgi:hypothetical protein